jgi:hypothetical protein
MRNALDQVLIWTKSLAVIALAVAVLSLCGNAQTQAPNASKYTPEHVNKKLSAFVYPSQKQTKEQQHKDQNDCFVWSEQQTSIDPMVPGPPPAAPATTAAQPDASKAGQGAVVGGAAKGAAKGAALGGITNDDAGKGAAIGATAGVVKGAAGKRKAKKQAEAQQKEAEKKAKAEAEAQAAAAEKERIGTFKRAYSSCLQGKGYSVQ